MLFPMSALIGVIHTLQAEEGKLFQKPAFLKATHIFGQKWVKVMELFPTHLPIQDDQRHQMGMRRSEPHIKLVHWNAQGGITKVSSIKTAIVPDDLDIVMIQDTCTDWMT